MDLGTPVFDMADIPAGDYWIQPMVNVYSEFKRADGHTVWMHDDQWEGQNWTRSPGNIYGKPQKVHYDPKVKATVALVADQVIPPIVVPPLCSISPLLSRRTGGHDARVLVPCANAKTKPSYPHRCE